MIKTVCVARHAKAAKDIPPGKSDWARPLTERGLKDAAHIGARLSRRGFRPAVILTSSAVRTVATAQILAQALHFDAARIQEEPALYNADVAALQKIILAIPAEHSAALVVGHNPELMEYIEYLTGMEIDAFPPASACGITVPVHNWNEIRKHTGRIAWLEITRSWF